MPFLSPTGNPPPGYTLPTAIGDTRVISYTYDPRARSDQWRTASVIDHPGPGTTRA